MTCCASNPRQFILERNHLQILRAIRPVVLPAHNEIAILGRMGVVAEIPALVFELNGHPLPLPVTDIPLRFAIWELRPQRFHVKPEPPRQHAEEKDHPALIHRRAGEPGQLQRPAINRPAPDQFCLVRVFPAAGVRP